MIFDLILRVGTKVVLPFILLFALYVQLHGDYGPGGGFQAGVIAAGMVILFAITFGLRAAQRVAPRIVVERMVPLGVLIFAGTGAVGMLLGGNFLDYSVLMSDPVIGQQVGIVLIEAGVGITVCGSLLSIFHAFAAREAR